MESNGENIKQIFQVLNTVCSTNKKNQNSIAFKKDIYS